MPFKKGNTINKGRKLSEERKQSIREKRLGYKFPIEFKEKMRQIALARPTSFLKGHVAWNKGTKGLMPSGCKSSAWKGEITSIDKLQRSKFRATIQRDVFDRDNYTCQICGLRNGNGKKVILQVDHMQPWAEYVELRFSMDNCRTLCMGCHCKITYGNPMPKTLKTWGQNFKQIESRNEGAT